MIEFWCELASTYTYLAASRIDALARRAGIGVVWRPFTLGPIFKQQGWTTSPFVLQEAKGNYMWRDVEREAEALGIAWRRPSAFPRNSIPAGKIAAALDGDDRARFALRALRANFAEDRDIGSPAVIAELLGELGLVAPADTGALRKNTEEAMRLGVFGAPTFNVAGELFWGNDRLERAIAWATARR